MGLRVCGTCVAKSCVSISKRTLSLSYTIVNDTRPTTDPPLLMIHGLLGNKNNFNLVAKLLGSRLQGKPIVSCDVRNHGESPHSDTMDYQSMSYDILELIDNLGFQKCTILGHSLGGRIAMHLALKKCEKVDKLVIVDVSPGNKDKTKAVNSEVIDYVRAMKNVRFEIGTKRSEARRSATQQLESAIPDKLIREFILTNITQNPDGSFDWRVNIDAVLSNAWQFGSLGDWDKLTVYEGDTLFLGGERSNYITPTDFPDIKQLFPNAVIKYIPKCGHWVHADKPHAFVDIVTKFILEGCTLDA